MIISILILLGSHVLLPLYFFYTLWQTHENDKFGWLVKALISGVFITYLFIAGRWDWLSVYLRYVYVAVYAVLMVVSYRRIRQRPFFAENGRSPWRRHGWALLELALFIAFVAYTASGFFYNDDPVRLALPLEDGRYYVGQGGNNPVLNAHNRNQTQKYALDITEINAAGRRAPRIYPSDPEQYVIFGETIHSPCDGAVVSVVDGLPDNNPPTRDAENLAGNHVVIHCKGVNVLLAHMQNNSVLVRENEMVNAGQPLGQVGNSGNTTEPHLHIHAVPEDDTVMDGVGVPLILEGDFPVRNTIFFEQ